MIVLELLHAAEAKKSNTALPAMTIVLQPGAGGHESTGAYCDVESWAE